MHLVAVASRDTELLRGLAAFRHPQYPLAFQPLRTNISLEAAARSLVALDFAGLLLLDARAEASAAALAVRLTEDAQASGGVDALAATEEGLVGDHSAGRAIAATLLEHGWPAAGASVVILGADGAARAAARALTGLGIRRVGVFGRRDVDDEGLELVGRLVARTDLVIRLERAWEVPTAAFGPHLTALDLSGDPEPGWLHRAHDAGATVVDPRDVRAHRLALAVGFLLGGRLAVEPFQQFFYARE